MLKKIWQLYKGGIKIVAQIATMFIVAYFIFTIYKGISESLASKPKAIDFIIATDLANDPIFTHFKSFKTAYPHVNIEIVPITEQATADLIVTTEEKNINANQIVTFNLAMRSINQSKDYKSEQIIRIFYLKQPYFFACTKDSIKLTIAESLILHVLNSSPENVITVP